jgi:erythromycin esterase
VAGETAHPKVAARDRGIAETVFWLLDRFGPNAKIVLGMHNSHLQRTPVHTPAFELSAAGHHLAERLGDDYLAVAVTCAGGRTATHRADPQAPGGVRIVGADLAPPVEGSVEAAFPAGSGPRVVDLRGARGRLAGPEAPVLDAYDLVVNLPEISPTSQAAGC